MRQAMATAEVGDDGWGDDPTVVTLQERVAAMLGHEAALFVPSGTMSNLIALRLLAPAGSEVLAEDGAHVVTYEHGGLAALGGIQTRTLLGLSGRLDPDTVALAVRRPPWFGVRTAALALEDTHVRSGGSCLPLELVRELRRVTSERDVALHLDGARLWHTSDGPAKAALADTVSVCLSKGLGAPVGSLLVSSARRIAQAVGLRKQLGGTMRQAGILAAAGLYALEHNLQRLPEDHARARSLAEGLAARVPWCCDLEQVQTNIVLVRTHNDGVGDGDAADADGADGGAAGVVAAAAAQGVLVAATGPRQLRLVTHLDVDDEGVRVAVDVLAGILGG
jgi:threonine aldolase